MMISVHPRVDQILKHIQPEWKILDLGCGDGYLKQNHPNTINIDFKDRAGVDLVANADWDLEILRRLQADCVVMSGLLEWTIYPLSIVNWALTKYPHVIFSYANGKADPAWFYETSIQDLTQLIIIKGLGLNYQTEAWEGQTIFIVGES